MGVSIITSLYRSAKHIDDYIEHIIDYSAQLSQVDIALEIVIVANDATTDEQQAIERLQQTSALDVTVLYVPRETLYTSWNRGATVAKYDVIGFWNVDDMRLADATIAAYPHFQTGADLVDMPFKAVNLIDNTEAIMPPFNPLTISPKHCMTTFALFSKSLYQSAGDFNENFKIAGDYEWSYREAVRESNYVQLEEKLGGYFRIHDANLSNGVNPLEWVEINIVLLWHGLDQEIRPVDPKLMQQAWETWGHQGGAITPQIAKWLWGDGSQARYEAYTKERAQHPLLRRVRLSLARRGLVQSVEWDTHHRPK